MKRSVGKFCKDHDIEGAVLQLIALAAMAFIVAAAVRFAAGGFC